MRVGIAGRLALSASLLGPTLAPAATPRSVAEMTARIDQLLEAGWKKAGVTPAPPATDAEFLRRAYLDLTGRIPRVGETREFLADTSADKRARLINSLLEKPNHATHLANTWRRFLLPDGADLRRLGGSFAFENWLRQQFADNRPYDAMVRELLTAEGRAQSGPVLFYTSLRSWACKSSVHSATIIPSMPGRKRTFGRSPRSLPNSNDRSAAQRLPLRSKTPPRAKSRSPTAKRSCRHVS